MMPVKRSQNWFPGIFNDFFGNEWLEKANTNAPAINIIENENEYKVDWPLRAGRKMILRSKLTTQINFWFLWRKKKNITKITSKVNISGESFLIFNLNRQ